MSGLRFVSSNLLCYVLAQHCIKGNCILEKVVPSYLIWFCLKDDSISLTERIEPPIAILIVNFVIESLVNSVIIRRLCHSGFPRLQNIFYPLRA
jgi:hypothetical protein